MGNAESLSVPGAREPYNDMFTPQSSTNPYQTEIVVALLCQQNDQTAAFNGTPINSVKQMIKFFLSDIYAVGPHTNIIWRTWDIEDADIVLSRDTHMQNEESNVFDVAVSMHCRFRYDDLSSTDFEIMCRLLKPQGLLLVPRSYESMQRILKSKQERGHPELLCGENTGLVPIFSEKSHHDVYVRGPFSSLKDDGLTVFQKC
ncbi:unnamed protein product [Ectocarpus sp. 12 AP-2014]